MPLVKIIPDGQRSASQAFSQGSRLLSLRLASSIQGAGWVEKSLETHLAWAFSESELLLGFSPLTKSVLCLKT